MDERIRRIVRDELQAIRRSKETPSRLRDWASVPEIQREVAEFYEVPVVEMLRHSRTVDNVQARQVAMYLTRSLTPLSYPVIGRAFDRDHTTVMHAYRQVSERMLSHQRFREGVNDVRRRLEEMAAA